MGVRESAGGACDAGAVMVAGATLGCAVPSSSNPRGHLPLAATLPITDAGLQRLPAAGDELITPLRHHHSRGAFSSRRSRERDLAPPRRHREHDPGFALTDFAG